MIVESRPSLVRLVCRVCVFVIIIIILCMFLCFARCFSFYFALIICFFLYACVEWVCLFRELRRIGISFVSISLSTDLNVCFIGVQFVCAQRHLKALTRIHLLAVCTFWYCLYREHSRLRFILGESCVKAIRSINSISRCSTRFHLVLIISFISFRLLQYFHLWLRFDGVRLMFVWSFCMRTFYSDMVIWFVSER